jgi:hypothetical protein
MKKHILIFTIIGTILFLQFNGVAQKSGRNELRATIAGIVSGDILKERIMSTSTINCTDPNYEIVYFSLNYFLKNGSLIVYKGEGNKLTESMKAGIRNIEPGTNVLIEDIETKSPEGKIFKLPSISLIIK